MLILAVFRGHITEKIMQLAAATVSYTHLDVYKRQVEHIPFYHALGNHLHMVFILTISCHTLVASFTMLR